MKTFCQCSNKDCGEIWSPPGFSENCSKFCKNCSTAEKREAVKKENEAIKTAETEQK